MKSVLRRRMTWVFVAGIALCGAIFFLYAQLSEPLFPWSQLSDFQSSQELKVYLENQIQIGVSSKSALTVFLQENEVVDCSELDDGTIACFTAAPRDWISTNNLVRDLLNYIMLEYFYRLVFGLADGIVTHIEVTKAAIGP